MASLKNPWSEKNVPVAVPVGSLRNRLGFSLVQRGLCQFPRKPLPSAEAGSWYSSLWQKNRTQKPKSQTRNERSQSVMQEHCQECQGQPTVLKPPDPPPCNSSSLKVCSVEWTVSSCSSTLDTYGVPLASCLWERSRDRGGQEKSNKERAREREKQGLLDRKGRGYPRKRREEIWGP